ncbi:hypothetical protein EG68_10578 [Paragonimus skrjabini miyazakii]|uniref:Uncharacterized protein n=1 Tax=Paragonimus skrjabini miyazakii TaxID=59628 RepID=A0A8S9YK89_9TREM|nr:hypothetical protein EG68_10578 [Paragonimus skrjabini miyazakii]
MSDCRVHEKSLITTRRCIPMLDEDHLTMDRLSRSPLLHPHALFPLYPHACRYLVQTINQLPSISDQEIQQPLRQSEPFLFKLDQNLNAFETDSSGGQTENESVGADPASNVSSGGQMRPPDIEVTNPDESVNQLSNPQTTTAGSEHQGSIHSGSIKYTTSVRALSPDGNLVESEIVRNYEIPSEKLAERPDHLIDETEQHDIWLEGLSGRQNDDESRPSINLTTRIKVSRTSDVAPSGSDCSEKGAHGSSTMPLGASAITPFELDAPMDHRRTSSKCQLQETEAMEDRKGQVSSVQDKTALSEERHRDTQHQIANVVDETVLLSFEECREVQRISKVSDAARKEINKLRDILRTVCTSLDDIQEGIVHRNFEPCVQFCDGLQVIPIIIRNLIPKLDYSPYEKDLWKAYNGIVAILEEVKEQPSLIIMRLVELGFYIYEIGTLLGEDVIPVCFAPVVHAIQTRVHRLCAGRVVRQIIYVPHSFDPVVATYYKDRRLERIENFCSCQIRLLEPSHPRAAYCPPDCRTLQVDFDPVRGKHVGLLDLLNRCIHPKQNVARIAVTIMRRANGTELELKAHELLQLRSSEARPRLLDVRADICLGPKESFAGGPGSKIGDSDVLSKSTLV